MRKLFVRRYLIGHGSSLVIEGQGVIGLNEWNFDLKGVSN